MQLMQLIISICLACNITHNSLAKEWRGIVPLKSTRADVERILGSNTNDRVVKYDLSDSLVFIEYSIEKPCATVSLPEGWELPPRDEWRVPPNLVVTIRIILNEAIPLTALSIDIAKFKKFQLETDTPNNFSYRNEKDGVSIQVSKTDGREFVQGYTYWPGDKYKNLRCTKKFIKSGHTDILPPLIHRMAYL